MLSSPVPGTVTLIAAFLNRGLARQLLWLRPAVPHDTREDDDDNDQHSSDSTTQYPANNDMRDEVADAVCLRPEPADHPAA